jgi:hypothetical protein
MSKLPLWLAALCVSLSINLAFARGGMEMHSSVRGGGAFGSSAASPGTNSLGTALSSSGRGNGRRIKGPALGTGSPVVDREDAQVAKIVRSSICRGC